MSLIIDDIAPVVLSAVLSIIVLWLYIPYVFRQDSRNTGRRDQISFPRPYIVGLMTLQALLTKHLLDISSGSIFNTSIIFVLALELLTLALVIGGVFLNLISAIANRKHSGRRFKASVKRHRG
jgi:hypothetical protein